MNQLPDKIIVKNPDGSEEIMTYGNIQDPELQEDLEMFRRVSNHLKIKGNIVKIKK